MEQLVGMALVALGAAVGFGFYFLPTIVAVIRKKRAVLAVFLLNLLLGWTAICWVIALVWSVLPEDPPRNSRPMRR